MTVVKQEMLTDAIHKEEMVASTSNMALAAICFNCMVGCAIQIACKPPESSQDAHDGWHRLVTPDYEMAG